MPAPRRTVSLLAALLGTAILAAAPEAQAAPRRASAQSAQRAAQPAPSPGAEAEPAPPRSRKPPPAPADPAASTAAPTHADQPVPKDSRSAKRRQPTKPAPRSAAASQKTSSPAPTSQPAAAPVPKDSKHAAANQPAAAPVPKDSKLAITRPAAAPVPKDSKPATPSTPAARARAVTPVPKDSKLPTAGLAADAPRKPSRLRPRREPLLARHPAASCALDPLEAVGLGQHGRARDSLREFYWSDMARFFETSVDMAEPVPQQADDPAFLASDAVLRELPASVRTALATVAGARVVDRLGEREFNKVSKLLASLSPAHVASLLRADSPTLRAYVWTWLATTKTGGCHLGHLAPEFIEAAVGDRSVAVEHGDDLVYRSLGDYALAARARLATLDPARFDAFLVRLTGAGEIDPLARATAHGILLRRGHWDTLALGLRDASPPVRAATAAAAIEMNRDKVEADMISHAASDPADLVTEQIVGALLGVYDPHTHGRPQLRGPLASTRDERLVATVARWRGRGDSSEPLPAPARSLRFVAVPVPTDMSQATASPPVPTDMSQATASPPVPADSQPLAAQPHSAPAALRSAPKDSQPVPADTREPARDDAATERRPNPLPSVLDDASDTGDLDELDQPSAPAPMRP